jgi:hypothetical protein
VNSWRNRKLAAGGAILAAALIATGALIWTGRPDSSERPYRNDSTDARLTVFEGLGPTCGSCTIELDPIGAIGSPDDAVVPAILPRVLRDSRGRTYSFAFHIPGHPIIVYDSAGRFSSVIGRRGNGPGEYELVNAATVGPGDTLHVAHNSSRISLFSPTGEFVRTVSTAIWRIQELLVPGNGSHAIAGLFPSAAAAGLSLHLHDASGEYERSIGSVDLLDTGGESTRMLAVGPEGSIWASERSNYRLEKIDRFGEVTRIIGVVPLPEWGSLLIADEVEADNKRKRGFIDATAMVMSRPEHMPFPPTFRISSLHAPDSRQVWAALHVAAPGWREVRMRYDPRAGTDVVPMDDMSPELYHTVIDIIDVASGNVIARRQVPGYGALANDGTFVLSRYNANGEIEVTLFRVRLVQ